MTVYGADRRSTHAGLAQGEQTPLLAMRDDMTATRRSGCISSILGPQVYGRSRHHRVFSWVTGRLYLET